MDRQAVLVALGPGGTTELAERVLVLLEAERLELLLEVVEPPAELGGLAEVCTELGHSRQTVGHWVAGRRNAAVNAAPFPEPLVTLSATPVWDLVSVRRWGVAVGLLEPSEVVG